mmetsp:Transcript_17079/g.40960  ORF Transcript_17079/g.40960 Transcript_17079/m.40960 type:complete len:165 (-) Transcript_17079:154-648(-)
MCIGITVVFLPPSVAISGYLFWYQGQRTVLTSHYNRSYIAEEEFPVQSLKSYALGLATLGGAYYAQSLAFPLIEGGTLSARELKEHAMSTRHRDHFSKNNKQFTVYKEGGPGRYAPPKNLFELAKRVAPPITLRVAASSMAFFCAGAVQTFIALKQKPTIRGIR